MPLDPLAAAFAAVEENAELLRGHTGPQGERGETGEQGIRGAQGTEGRAGTDGEDGEPGLTWRGPWKRGTVYAPGDVVESGGSSWVALDAGRLGKPPSKSWDLVAKKGRDGQDGMSGGGGGSGTGSGSALTVLDEGVSLDTAVTSIDFVGANVEATNVGHAVTVTVSGGAGGAPDDADYLVGTAQAGLSNEIVVGATPGGELGGTWASPTVDATHSGSAHHDPVTVGTGLDVTGQLVELDLSEVAAGGELGGFMDAPTVDATHSGSTHSTATDAHIADATDAHDASAISVLDTGTFYTATDVEGVLAEIAPQLGGSTNLYVQDADPGAVGAGNLWLNTTGAQPPRTIQVRNDADDGWQDLLSQYVGISGLQITGLADGLALGAEVIIGEGSGTEAGYLSFRGGDYDSNTGAIVETIGASDVGHGWVRVTTGALAFDLLAGTADPSGGGGVAANIGSQYTRDNAGTGELWFKTGAADTGWTQVI